LKLKGSNKRRNKKKLSEIDFNSNGKIMQIREVKIINRTKKNFSPCVSRTGLFASRRRFSGCHPLHSAASPVLVSPAAPFSAYVFRSPPLCALVCVCVMWVG
jgi:hypothetical protein